MYYGFANSQLVLYISIVKIWNKKKVTFLVPPFLSLLLLFSIIASNIISASWYVFIRMVDFKCLCIHSDSSPYFTLVFACCDAILCIIQYYCTVLQLLRYHSAVGVESVTVVADTHRK